MATNLTAWKPEISLYIPKTDERSVVRAVRNAAIEFCEKTWLWTYTLTDISVVADQQDYTLTDPTDSEIIAIDNVRYKENGADNDQFTTLTPISENQMDLHDTGSWMYRESSQPSSFWVDVVEKVLHLYPIPTDASTSGLLVKAILRPDDACTSVPDFLYQEHRQAIVQGTLAELFSQEALNWSDLEDPTSFKHLLNKSINYKRLFNNSCNQAKIKKFTGATKRALRVKFQSFC